MIISSRAIVISKVKYGDTSIILKLFCEKYGVQSFIIKGVFGKKSRISPAVIQPCSLVEYVAYYQHEKNIHRLTDIRLTNHLDSIQLPIEKITILIFLSEILSKSLTNEPHANSELFEYMWYSFSHFFTSIEKASNFHLIFLIQLASYLGFSVEQSHPEWHSLISEQALLNFTLPINGNQRVEWLQQIIHFYQEHILDMKEIKSLKILQQVFA